MNDQDPEWHGPEGRDPVWRLLGRARPVEVRPAFCRTVLETVRKQEQLKTDRWAWLRTVRSPAARPAWLTATAALVAAGWWLAHRPSASDPAQTPPVAAVAPDPAEELADQIASELVMIDEVDDLLAPESAQDLAEEDLEPFLF